MFILTRHHESDGSLLVDVDGNIRALDPRVGAQVSQSNKRVPETNVFIFTNFSFSATIRKQTVPD